MQPLQLCELLWTERGAARGFLSVFCFRALRRGFSEPPCAAPHGRTCPIAQDLTLNVHSQTQTCDGHWMQSVECECSYSCLSHGLHVSSGLSVCVISFRCVLASSPFPFLFSFFVLSQVMCSTCVRFGGNACVLPQGVGVFYIHVLPASLFVHLSTGQAVHPPTHRTTLNEQSRALTPHFWPCNHHMCVIAKELGAVLDRLAHAAEHGYFLRASTSGRTVSTVSTT